MQHFLHKPVAYFILPLFALANTAIVINPGLLSHITENHSLGIIVGLVLGKPIGIIFCSAVAVYFKWVKLPEGVNWKLITGAAILGGIGFTMSIFISMLAYTDETLIASSKLAVLIASSLAAIAGMAWLLAVTNNKVKLEK